MKKLLLPVALLLAGCSKTAPPTSTTTATTTAPVAPPSPPIQQRKAPPLTLRTKPTPKAAPVGPPVSFGSIVRPGEKFKWVGISEIRADATTTPAKVKSVDSAEVLSVKNGVSSWKIISTQTALAMGGHEFLQGKALDNNRITLTTQDARGNLLNSEGHDPESPVAYKTMPTRPIRINESWRGYSIVNEKPYTDIYTLKSIANIGGRRIAVINKQDGYLGSQLKTTLWIDLKTGILCKVEAKGRTQNAAGDLISLTYSSILVDAKGAPRFAV
jgi:hypothetical protein